MFYSYLKIALRNIYKERVYAVINVLGLAIGISASIVIFMHVRTETSYDKHFKDANQIYRIGISFMNLGSFANAPEHLKDVIDQEIPGVEQSTRIRATSDLKIVNKDDLFVEARAYNVDSNFFQVFSYNFVEGDAVTALQNPDGIVLERSVANKIFGDGEVLGKNLLVGKERTPATVSGVVDSQGERSHLDATVWRPIYHRLTGDTGWQSATFYTYLKVNSGITLEDLSASFEQIRKNVVFPTLGSSMVYDDWAKTDMAYQFHIQPLQDIYFKSELKFELAAGGNLDSAYIFSVVAFLILVIAAINFINLTTARSARRAREVGIRKTFGTSKFQLVAQFLSESVALSLIAMIFAFGLVEVFLIMYEQIAGVGLVANPESRFGLIGFTILTTVTIGVLAGIYPAFYMSAFNPISVLKSKSFINAGGSGSGRNILVVFQFTISITLIISSLFIFNQLDYMRNKDLGFDKENVVVVSNARELKENLHVFNQLISGMSFVQNTTIASRLPAGNTIMVTTYKSEYMENEKSLNSFTGDYEFLSTLGIQPILGRDFSESISSDSNAVIINESAVRELLLGANPVGQMLNRHLTVIGVVEDFNFESLERKIAPAVIRLADDGFRLAVKVSYGYEKQLISELNKHWTSFQPDEPIDYYFLESNFLAMQEKDETTARAIAFFTTMAIFISCLGLFGLAAYTSEQRTKEIGIRKVLGASVFRIMYLLTQSLTKPVLLSFLLAAPIAYFVVTAWLNNFAYRINLNISVFVTSLILATLLAWITVGYYSINLAMKNPVNSLQEE